MEPGVLHSQTFLQYAHKHITSDTTVLFLPFATATLFAVPISLHYAALKYNEYLTATVHFCTRVSLTLCTVVSSNRIHQSVLLTAPEPVKVT